MSYESAPATKMLATQCAACGRPLVDALSVETGMGPICREKYGSDVELDDEKRAVANHLIYFLALNQGSNDERVMHAVAALWELGLKALATKVGERFAAISVEVVGEELHVTTPYHERASFEWHRSVPGQKWDATKKVRRIPIASRVALYKFLMTWWPGAIGFGPKGLFVVGVSA